MHVPCSVPPTPQAHPASPQPCIFPVKPSLPSCVLHQPQPTLPSLRCMHVPLEASPTNTTPALCVLQSGGLMMDDWSISSMANRLRGVSGWAINDAMGCCGRLAWPCDVAGPGPGPVHTPWHRAEVGTRGLCGSLCSCALTVLTAASSALPLLHRLSRQRGWLTPTTPTPSSLPATTRPSGLLAGGRALAG